MGMFTGLGYWTRGNPEMCLLATKGENKQRRKTISNIHERTLKTQPLLHKEIERLVDGHY